MSRRDDRRYDSGAALGSSSASEMSRAAKAAGALERFARSDFVRPSDGFADAVMLAIAREPLPSPAVVLGLALREGRLGGLLAGLVDSWRVARTDGRPLAMRLQGFAFVLLVALATVSLTATLAVGARALLFRNDPVTPSVVAPSPPPPSIHAIEAAPSQEPTTRPSAPPTESSEPTPTPASTPRQPATPKPAATPHPTETEAPNESEEPGDVETPNLTATPHPTGTLQPTETPGSTDGGGSGSGSSSGSGG
jgi:hypothetical protein